MFIADNGEQSVVTVRFDNMPDGNLLIRKVCATNPSVTLQNAEFKIMYADGRLIGDSNGIYRTDENGEELKHRRNNETVFSALSQAELDKLSTTDHYPSDSYVFSSYGCDLPIENERVAEAFASLSPRDQSILILHCVLDLTDKEIGWVMGLSRSAVQKRRTGTLKVLRSKLTALVPGGGD